MTLGNIITVLVCICVVLLFRQLDSKNRSIDKVRKFTEKLKADFEEYFSKHSESLRNASVDLDVKLPQAIAAVKRLETIREEFSQDNAAIEAKITALEKIEQSIRQYDETIETLLGMTDRADENLQKISGESNRLNKVQKTIAEMHTKLDKLSSQIPQIASDFAKQNSEQMQLLSSGIISNFENKAAALQSRFEVSETKCEDLFVSIENTVQASFTAAAAQAEKLENATLAALQKDFQDKVEKARSLVWEDTGELRAALEEKVAELTRLQSQLFDSVQSSAIERVDGLRNGLEQRATELEFLQQSEYKRIEEQTAQNTQSLDSRLAQIESVQNNSFARIDETSAERTAALRAELDEKIALAQREYIRVFGELEQRSGAQLGLISERLNEAVAAQNETLSHLDETAAERTAALRAELDEKIALAQREYIRVFDELEQRSGAQSEHINERLSEAIAAQKALFDEFEQFASERSAVLHAGLDEKIAYAAQTSDQAFLALEQQAAEHSQNIGEKLNEAAAAQKAAFEAFERLSADRTAAIQLSVDEKLAATEQEIVDMQSHSSEALRSLQEDFVDRLKSANAALNEKIAAMAGSQNESFDKLYQDALDRSAQIRAELEKRIAETGTINTSAFEMLRQESRELSSSIQESFTVRAAEITDQLNRLQETSLVQISRLNAEMDEQFAALRQNQDSGIDSLRSSLDENVEAVTSESGVRLAAGQQEALAAIAAMQQSLADRIAVVQEEMSVKYDDYKQQVQRRAAEVEAVYSDLKLSLEEKSGAHMDEIRGRVNSFEYAIRQESDECLEAAREEIRGFNIQFQDTVQRCRDELDSVSSLSGSRFEECAARIHENDSRISEIESDYSGRLAAMNENLEKQFSQLSQNLERQSAEIGEKIAGSYLAASDSIEKTNATIFSQIEKHFEAYKSDMLYRFERIEKTASDIDQLDGDLRDTMDLVKEQVSADFQSYADDQEKRQGIFEKNMQDRAQTLSQYMQRVERELAELKSSAYENVSEKLKMFEDDFFVDLGKRGEAIDVSLSQWKASIENKLSALAAETEDDRRKIEQRYSEDLRIQLGILSDKTREQTAKIEEYLKKAEQDSLLRITLSGNEVAQQVEQVRSELADAKITAREYMEREFAAHNAQAQEQFKKQEAEIAQRLNDLAEEVDSSRSQATAALDAARDDLTLWRERVKQQFDETRDVFDEKLASMQVASEEMLTQVKSSFKSDADEYAALASEEKKRVIAEFDELKNSINLAVSGFEQRSEETVEDFRKSYESMLEETQRRIREQNSEADHKLRSLKAMAQEIRDKNEEAQQRMILKMQTDSSNLNMVMDDIDKRLKGFLAQTQLFDRADSLKLNLESQIVALRADSAKLDSFKQTSTDLEQQFAKIRRMEEEVSQKLTRFAGDKKRIEIMEADFNHLMNVSESIDQKMSELKSTGDELQVIQLDIRKFQENLTDIGLRYERLEKKNDILDKTIIGVDKTFDTLAQLEKRLNSCTQETTQLPMKLAELSKTVDKILDTDGRINDTASKLDSLDQILSETDAKMKSMMKSREWLAKLETRLEEINRQAQSEVKILGDLFKEDFPKSAETGAPPLSARETAIKLNHQGWKVEEIARATKLSRGEVELILELGIDQK